MTFFVNKKISVILYLLNRLSILKQKKKKLKYKIFILKKIPDKNKMLTKKLQKFQKKISKSDLMLFNYKTIFNYFYFLFYFNKKKMNLFCLMNKRFCLV